MQPRQFVILIAFVLACGALALTRDATTQPTTQVVGNVVGPVSYRHIERSSPRAMHLHVVSIDTADPRVHVRVCRDTDDPDGPGPWQTRLRSARETAGLNNLYCAINANYFAAKESREVFGRKIPYFIGNPSRVWGWAMSDGQLWSEDPGSRCALIVHRDRRVTIQRFEENVPLPADAFQVVTGSELIVTDGKVTTNGTDRAPRTAVGIDRGGKRMIMLVVDGRDVEYSAGMTSAELAGEMIALGCDRAIMLDGGGSSTMVLLDEIEKIPRVVNRPSDGHDLPVKLSLERPVACVLGVELRDDHNASSTTRRTE